MKVIIEKNGINAHSVNDKAVISHGVAQKTELSKKSGGGLEKQQVRTVGGTEKATKPDVPNGAPFVVQKRADFAKAKSAQTESLKAALTPNAEKQLTSAKSKVLEPKHKIASSRPPKQFKLSENRPKNKSYKVLNNGTLADKGITKRKERVIYRKQNSALKKSKPRAIDKSKLKSLKGLKNGQKIIPKPRKLTSAAQSTANIAAKPANTLKNEFMSQAAKSDNSGVKAINLGLQTADYGGRTIKTAVNKGIKTARDGAKITKRIHRTLRTSTPELRRKLKKQVNHNLAKTTKKVQHRQEKQQKQHHAQRLPYRFRELLFIARL